MDYEQKYKEALERARTWKEKSGMPENKQSILDDIFPELKGSKELPKTWEEFCETHPLKLEEAFIGSGSSTYEVSHAKRCSITDKNILPSKKYAEAMLALCQLIQLRDCYNGSWRPDWHLDKNKYCIYYNDGKIVYTTSTRRQFVLAFETSNLREEFYKNFVGLINIAKLLL